MGHVYAIFTILVWGSCFVLTKQMLTAYTAIQIIPLRMGLAYITLWALRPKTLKLPWKDELMFILIGVTGGSFYFFLQNTALTYTFAANVSIIIALSPILTVIWPSCSPAMASAWVNSCTSARSSPSPVWCWWCSTAS